MEKMNGEMSMSVDSCSTSSGCVSDIDNLSEDPSPDSPISSADSLLSITNSALNSLPNDIRSENINTETILIIKDVEEVAEDELMEEELIESEIVIDSIIENTIPVVAENNFLEIYNNDRNNRLTEFNSSFDCSSSISSYKSETASIKSDTGSSLESDHKSSICRPLLNAVFKEDNSSSNYSNSVVSNGLNGSGFCCKWTHCDWPGNYDDLVDHIREIHVELQPYQQQKHVWKSTELSKNNKNHLINRLNDRKITDNNNNNSNNNLIINNLNNNKKCESQQYVCLWEGCKVYGKGSLSRNWLERHVLEQHSGPRPFKCIVEGCGARFKVQSALERHVNSHFKPNVDFSNNFNNCNNSTINPLEPSTSSSTCSHLLPSNCMSSDNSLNHMNALTPFEMHLQQSSRATMMRCKSIDSNTNTNHFCKNYCNSISSCNTNNTNNTNGTPNKILKRKKSATKLRRKCIIVKYSEDFFDECVMEQVRYGLIQLNAQTGLDISGTQSTVTFHSKVIARRKNDSTGDVNVLLKWEPNNILQDIWVSEPEASKMKIKTIPVSLLPPECLAQLIEMNGERKPKMKQRRK